MLGPEMAGPLAEDTAAVACCGRRRTTVLTVTLLDEDEDADAGGGSTRGARAGGGGKRTRVFSARWYLDASLRVCWKRDLRGAVPPARSVSCQR